jgi:hypothetical protein
MNAFPSENMASQHRSGMTLRDYFAAKMMPSELNREMQRHEGYNYENAAKRAYLMADAMMKAREA